MALVQGALAEDGLTEKGQRWVTETFEAVLDLYGMDPAEEFGSFGEIVG